MSENDKGIYLETSPLNTLKNNTFANYRENLKVTGNSIQDYVQDIDTSNTINGNPVYYLVGRSGLVFDGVPMGYLALISCNNIIVKNIASSMDNPFGDLDVTLINTTSSLIGNCSVTGIYSENSSNNTFCGNNVNGQIYLKSSDNNIISGNYVYYYHGGPVALALSAKYSANDNYSAIYLESSNKNIIVGNYFNGITLLNSLTNIISDNNITNTYSYGIYLDSSSNNVLSNNNINSVSKGIYIYNSSNNLITANNVSNTYDYGIYIDNSPENTLRNNSLTNNSRYNFGITGDDISDYIEDIDTSNTINGNPVYYLVGRSGLVFDGVPMGYLALISCNNITVKNVLNTENNTPLAQNDVALLMVNTTNSTVENCNMTYNENGICIYNSSNNTISGNNVCWYPYGTYGIHMENSNNNTIKQNIFKSDYNGYLEYGA